VEKKDAVERKASTTTATDFQDVKKIFFHRRIISGFGGGKNDATLSN